jgi:hypothetical protein
MLIVAQNRAATVQWSAMWLAVSRVASQRGQPAPAASTMVFWSSMLRVWIHNRVRSHPKNMTLDGARLLQMKSVLAETIPPKLQSL